jgi:hypothetical protein
VRCQGIEDFGVALGPSVVDGHAFEAPFLAVAEVEARMEDGGSRPERRRSETLCNRIGKELRRVSARGMVSR